MQADASWPAAPAAATSLSRSSLAVGAVVARGRRRRRHRSPGGLARWQEPTSRPEVGAVVAMALVASPLSEDAGTLSSLAVVCSAVLASSAHSLHTSVGRSTASPLSAAALQGKSMAVVCSAVLASSATVALSRRWRSTALHELLPAAARCWTVFASPLHRVLDPLLAPLAASTTSLAWLPAASRSVATSVIWLLAATHDRKSQIA